MPVSLRLARRAPSLGALAMAAGIAVGLASHRAWGQPAFFVYLPNLPGGSQVDPRGVSPEGDVVVGSASTQGSATFRAFRWTRQNGIANLGIFSGGESSMAFDAGQNGGMIVGVSGSTGGNRAFRWSGLIVNMGVLAGMMTSEAYGVSDDGTVIVGNSSSSTGGVHGFRWTSGTGMVDLGPSPWSGQPNVYVSGISGDGQVIVGTATPTSGTLNRAFRWQGGVYQELPPLPGGTSAAANAANLSGSVIIGNSESGGAYPPVRWTAAGVENLGMLPGAINATPAAVSGDGSVIVGYTNTGISGRVHGFIWTPGRGVVDLNTLLPSMGINLGGLMIERASAVNSDGTVIAGYATLNGIGNMRGWVLDLRGDSDGDGLRDDWEINGIPYVDAAGSPQRYLLPGANPAHKDLYVEVDRMAGVNVDQNAIDMVVQAFADSPMVNPDGVTGVNLHVQIDEGDLPYVAQWHTNGCWPDDYDQAYITAHYGTAAERADPAGLPLRLAKAKAYRYGVLADRADPSIGGCGKIGGDWFVVFTGGAGPSADHQATAFMHEFGHNLGLKHGGGDHTNGKPNYPSIMNYVTAYKAPWNEGFWRLDYSRVGPEGFATLNEVELDETAGIGTLLGYYHDWVMPFGVNAAPGGPRQVRYALLNGSPVDYGSPNGNGVPDGQYDTGIIQDLNYVASPPPGVHLPSGESGGDTLEPYNDWEHVVLAPYGARGPGAPLPVDPTEELTIAARDWMAANFPPPGGSAPCYANCDGSTQPPILNVLDFNCFLNAFSAGQSYANCDGSTIAPVLNVLDFNCFLNRFSAGCP